MPPKPLPTDAELAILTVLWRRGPSTVRDVFESLRDDAGTGYTTVLKLLQIMMAKGLVKRDESQRSHVYRAAASEEQTQKRLVGDLLDRAFGGSAQALVMRAVVESGTMAATCWAMCIQPRSAKGLNSPSSRMTLSK